MKEIFENVVYSPDMLKKIFSLMCEDSNLVFLLGENIDEAVNIAKNLLIGLEEYRKVRPNGRYLLHIKGVKITDVYQGFPSGEIIMDVGDVVSTGRGDMLTHLDFIKYLSRDFTDKDFIYLLYLICKEKELSLETFKKIGKNLHFNEDLDKEWEFYNNVIG